jgi:hypothetical protein
LKIRIDENLSPRVAAALKGFMGGRSGFSVDYVGDHHPPRTSDPSWIRQFASEGGNAIISGDAKILANWPDLIAYMESGLIGFFPPPKFNDLKGAGQAALIMRWWPCIIEKAKVSKPSDCWRLKLIWNPDVTDFEALKDPRFATAEARTGQGCQPVATVHQFRA